MSVFDHLGPQQADPRQMLQQLRQDPAGTLRQAAMTIPKGMQDPQQIIQHLVQSGQVPAARYQQALQMLGRRR